MIILNLWILLLLITSSANTYDGNIIDSFQALPQWIQYFNPSVKGLNLLNHVQIIGSMAALPVSPYVADGLGRRTSMFIGALIMCAATAIQTAATSLGLFIGARFLIGFGVTFATTAAPILIAEIAYPTYRGPLTAAYNSLWYSGAIAAAWSTFGAAKIQTTWAWRLPSILQLVPSVLQVALIWNAPESPRWLIGKNRNAEALQTLAYYHADSNEDDPLVRFEYRQIKAAIEREAAAKVGWKTLFATSGYKKRMNIIMVLAFYSPWYAYPLKLALITAGITNPNTLLLINGLLQLWNLFCALVAAFLVDKVGRRTLFLTSVTGTMVFLSLLTACSTVYNETKHQAAARAFIAFIFLFYAFFNLAFPTLLVSYSVEIFPYSLRAKGFTFFNLFSCLASIVNLHLRLPVGIGPFTWNIFYVVLLLGQGCIFWYFVVETKNCTLEEAGTVFDENCTTEQAVSSTHSSEEDEKGSQSFHVVVV